MSEGQAWVLIGAVFIGIGALGEGHLNFGGQVFFICVGSALISHGFHTHYRKPLDRFYEWLNKKGAEREKRRRS